MNISTATVVRMIPISRFYPPASEAGGFSPDLLAASSSCHVWRWRNDPSTFAFHLREQGEGHGEAKEVVSELLPDVNPCGEVCQPYDRPRPFRLCLPVGVDAYRLAAGGIGDEDVFVVPPAVIGQDHQGGKLVRIGEEDHRLWMFFIGAEIGQRPEDDIALRDLRDGEARNEPFHLLRRFEVSLTVDEIVIELAPHEGFDHLRYGGAFLPPFDPGGEKVTESLLAAGKAFVDDPRSPYRPRRRCNRTLLRHRPPGGPWRRKRRAT